MSIDLRVVTTRQPESGAISDFLAERRERHSIEGSLQAGSGNVTVSVEKRGNSVPIFMLDGPFKIEPEDVEEALVGLVLAPQWLTEVNIPSSSSQADRRLARSLGVQLAKTFQGAIYDPQEDVVVWPKRRPKYYKTPQAAETIEVVSLSWHLPYSRRVSHTAKVFVDVAKKHLRESLPRRYGLFEPLQGKVEGGDFNGFYAMWEEAASHPYGDTLHFSGSTPCFGGSVSFSDPRDEMPSNMGAAKIVKLQMDFDGRALRQSAWLHAVASLFTRLSRAIGSFYAVGYVERGIEAKGNHLSFVGGSEHYPLPRHDRWLGIPPIPAWMTWFGPPYSETLQAACAKDITEKFEEGFLIRLTMEPSDIDSIAANFPKYPRDLQAKLSEQTLSRQLASIFDVEVLPSDDQMRDRPADVVLALD